MTLRMPLFSRQHGVETSISLDADRLTSTLSSTFRDFRDLLLRDREATTVVFASAASKMIENFPGGSLLFQFFFFMPSRLFPSRSVAVHHGAAGGSKPDVRMRS